ncbi:MAG: hypothetical protein WAP44_06765, partial [Lentibacter algarum]|uniref:hypothetical protein n=1 Tax=Lentibacter algarum TaxID=576131 RepID=UPI003BB1AED4
MNGWFSRCAAAPSFTLTQYFPRCERMQRENRTHRMGSNQPFAAFRTNDRDAGRCGLLLLQLLLVQHLLVLAGRNLCNAAHFARAVAHE